MTTRKKLGFGLGFVGLFFVVLVVGLIFPKKTLAYTQPELDGATLEFVDASHIKATIGGQDITFFDSNPGDYDNGDFNYKAQGQVSCGLQIDIVSGNFRNRTVNNPTLANAVIKQSLGVTVPLPGCSNAQSRQIQVGKLNLSRRLLQYDDKNTVSLIHKPDTKFTRTDSTPAGYFFSGTGTFGASGVPVDTCPDGVFVSSDPDAPGAYYFQLDGDRGPSLNEIRAKGGASKKLVDLIVKGFGTRGPAILSGCDMNYFNSINFRDKNADYFKDYAGTFVGIDYANANKEPTDPDAADATGVNNTCEGKNNTGLEWLLCGIISSVDKMVDWMNDAINDQLDFNVKQNLEDPAGIKQAWSAIKNIATALLVIIMLVMVISQAIGGALFDAYTIRKLLPKMVVAVIAMQLSWDLCIWIISLANDAGRGIGNLLAAPFGGWNQLSLDKLIGGLGVGAPGVTLLTALTVGTLAVALNPFGVLLLGFVILVGVFAALATLLFRVVLIIAAVIFAPLALVAWLLPGTERYWKQWVSNFSKALLLFPLIVSMIVIGRIFAWIISSGGAGTVGPFDLFAVVVGYFGPYFLLPKAFKWGGSLLATAAKGVSDASTKFSERPKKLLQTRQEGFSAERARQSQERYSKNEGFNPRRPWRRPIDLLKSGQVDPTLWGRRRKQATDSYVFQGIESEEKDLKSANARAQDTINRTHFDEQDNFARALAAGQKVSIGTDGRIQGERYVAGATMRNGRTATGGELKTNADGTIVGAVGAEKATEVESRAGFDQVVRLGGDGNIEFLQSQLENALTSGDPEKISGANRIMTAHAPTLFKKMPHLYKNGDYHTTHNVERTIGGLNAPDLTELSAPSFKTMLEQTQQIQPATGRADPDSEARLVNLYMQTLNDTNRRGSLVAETNREMFRYATTLPAGDPRKAELLRHLNPAGDGTLLPV